MSLRELIFGRRPLPEDLPREVDWTDRDAGALRQFMQSETGLKLGVTLRRLTISESLAAMHADPEKLSRECGRCVGLQDAARYLDQLAQWTGTQAKETTGATDDLTWLHERQSNST